MADIATPSAAAISTIDAGAQPPVKTQKPKVEKTERPEKPNEEQYKEALRKAEQENAAAQEKLNAIKAKVDLAQPNNKDSPAGKRQQEVKSELASIRQQQSGFKNSRGDVQGKIAALDSQLKSRIAEHKVKRGQVSWKSVQEIDVEIQRQEKIAESSTATLVDQKKAIAEVSNLRKQKKAFGGFDEAQKAIDTLKTQIADLRKSLDNPETKALSAKYDELNKELNSIKANQDEAYKNLNSLRDERTKLHALQQEKYLAVRDVKDKYHKARVAYRDYENEQYRIRQTRQKEEREAFQKEKRKKIAAQKLQEASEPAYMDDIFTAEGLIRYFDPSSSEAARSLVGPSGFAAEAQRSVDTKSEIKGMKISRKEDREDDYFVGTGGKKGKKGKKGGSAAASPAPGTPIEGKFNLSIGIIEELAKVGLEPPMNQAGVPAVVDKLKEKRDQWKKDQDSKTKENIAKAQKEIDRLEEEAAKETSASASSPPSSSSRRTHDSAKKSAAAHAHQAVNGTVVAATSAPDAEAELAQEKDAVADVTEDVRQASLEDGKD